MTVCKWIPTVAGPNAVDDNERKACTWYTRMFMVYTYVHGLHVRCSHIHSMGAACNRLWAFLSLVS